MAVRAPCAAAHSVHTRSNLWARAGEEGELKRGGRGGGHGGVSGGTSRGGGVWSAAAAAHRRWLPLQRVSEATCASRQQKKDRLARPTAARTRRGAAAAAVRRPPPAIECRGAAWCSPAVRCVGWANDDVRKTAAGAHQQQRQRRNDGGGKALALLESQGASECAGGVVDAAGIAVQQPLSLHNVKRAGCSSGTQVSPVAPTRSLQRARYSMGREEQRRQQLRGQTVRGLRRQRTR